MRVIWLYISAGLGGVAGWGRWEREGKREKGKGKGERQREVLHTYQRRWAERMKMRSHGSRWWEELVLAPSFGLGWDWKFLRLCYTR